LISGKERGLNVSGWNIDYRRIIFLKRIPWTKSTGLWNSESTPVYGPWWTSYIPFRRLLILATHSRFDDQEIRGARQQRPRQAAAHSSASRRDGPSVHRSSPRGAGDGVGMMTNPFFEVVERGEVGVELTMVRSGQQHSVPVGLDEERGAVLLRH
jgi:hypothetical protein